MRVFDTAAVRDHLPWPALIDALAIRFQEGCAAPTRHHHGMSVPGEAEATLLLMPAWALGEDPSDRICVVKIATVYPGNGARGLPAVAASVLALDGATGMPLAILDGGEVTARRTAAASALAARFLVRKDARTMVMVGAGRLAPNLIEAHLTVRPSLERVLLWARDPAKAQALRAELAPVLPIALEVATDLEAAVRAADLVSCATLSREPLVLGDWLKPGAHLDLVGAFTPQMRECDDEAVRRCQVHVDTRNGALSEGGDMVQALASGALTPNAVVGDLFDLCRGQTPGRTSPGEITLFKSVGAALEDLAAAQLVLETA
ncbi:MAG: ornithine cyclodeaminase family protein [Rhodospirillum sp.]|nr:ornithine cyclodeaminase family protein [Rhodospirillum sp.]MCF8489378.1 ornithine cyclodeaminase family protein [Rhodospirillum sp.]MCF8501722.1 ornithine cyclodeaminase family protein [Rhodospirillum sp.]